jgi:hypothetical protein
LFSFDKVKSHTKKKNCSKEPTKELNPALKRSHDEILAHSQYRLLKVLKMLNSCFEGAADHVVKMMLADNRREMECAQRLFLT